MTKNWWKALWMVILTGSILCGCGKSEKGETYSEPVEFPEYFEKSYSCLDFKTEIIVSDEADVNELYRFSMKRAGYDTEKAYEALFFDVEIKEIHEGDSLGDAGKRITWEDYIGAEGEYLYMNGESLTYGHPFVSYIMRCLRPETKNPKYNLDKYELNGQLDFADYEKGSKEIVEVLKTMGFPVDTSELFIKSYAMNHEIMEQEEYAMDMQGNEDTSKYKDSWTPEDDCYYYIMRQKIEGLPLYYIYGGQIKRMEECYTNIEALYSKDGIQRLSVNKIFDVSHPENIKEVSLMPLESLTEEVNEQYEMLLSNAVYKVNRMELYMMAEQNIHGNYDVFPVWVMWMEQEDGETKKILQNVIDAETGKIIS